MSTLALELYRVSAIVQSKETLYDKAVFLDSENFTDRFYTLIATGNKLAKLARAVGLEKRELDYVLKRTPSHQQRLLNARAVALGSKAFDRLETKAFTKAKYLDKEENNAAKHHKSMAELAMKSVGSIPSEESTSKIVVHNTVQVLNADLPPPPQPRELQEILGDNNGA